MNIRALVFDFDGVIVESTEIKTEAFKELFSQFPDQLGAIIRHHKENEGVSRYKKFKFIHEKLLNIPYSPEIEKELDQKFKKSVLDRIKKCPFVKGALEFIEDYCAKYPLYIVSGTPDDELKEIVNERWLTKYFTSVFGSKKTKSECLDMIIDREQIQPGALLFIGDALSDYHAAADKKTLFIGRIQPGRENIFPLENLLTTINDLTELSVYMKNM